MSRACLALMLSFILRPARGGLAWRAAPAAVRGVRAASTRSRAAPRAADARPAPAAGAGGPAVGTRRLILFDLETTGLSKARNRVVEVAAYDPVSGATYSSLVNPGDTHRLSSLLTRLTGLSDAQVRARGVPSFAEALDGLVAFAGAEAVLCAHNCRAFDAPFLAAEAARAGRFLPRGWRFADSLASARSLFAQPWVPARPPRMSLDALAVFVGIDLALARPTHRALDDARLLHAVLEGLDMRFGLARESLATFELDDQDARALAGMGDDDEAAAGSGGGAAAEAGAGASVPAPAPAADAADVPPPAPAAAADAAGVAAADVGGGGGAPVKVGLAEAAAWELPPMLRHYVRVKERHAHALLLFRVGDFFEAYFDDAPTVAHALGMTLTRRALRPQRAGGGERAAVHVAMCGFPLHTLEKHARALLAAGHPVALCQQYVVDARARTVRRSLERVLTPGTLFDDWLPDAAHNFVAALLPAEGAGAHGLVYADVTTGEVWATASASAARLGDELARIAPAEILVPQRRAAAGAEGGEGLAPLRYLLPGQAAASPDVPSWAPAGARYLVLPRADFKSERATQALAAHYGPLTPTRALGLADAQLQPALHALGALLRYVQATTAAADDDDDDDGGGGGAAADADADADADAPAARGGGGKRKAAGGRGASADAESESNADTDAAADGALGLDGAELRRSRGARLRLPRVYALDDAMSLDEAARRNLELERTARTGEKRGSLLWALDCTRTPMGSRLMRQWLLRPSLDAAAIGARHDAVEALTHRHAARAQLRRALRGVHDLERLLTRVETRRASPRCVAAVANSLAALADVDGCLRALAPTAAAAADGGAAAGAAAAAADAAAANVAALLAPPADGGAERLRELAEHIRATLVASPPARLGDGACIGDGAAARHAPLAAARADAAALGAVLATVEAREAAASGLAGGVRCISVRGELVLSVKGAAALDALGARAPAHWLEVPCAAARGKERRFVTHEMRAAEAKLARVSARIAHLEAALFDALLDRVDARAPDARAACARAARADVLSAFAHTAVAEGYCRPAVLPLPRAEDAAAAGAGHVMRVERARHPVVERLLADGAFVSNPINLGAGAAAGAGNGNGGGGAGGRGVPDLLVLTGPNAGGKSVYLRTLGVLQILAQAGSFVPADAATLTVADRLFTRVGAVDDIGGGQSTFTVEMRETAEILRHATRASLVLLDEVGRGTAAADGVAIARAVAEHLASSIGCRALFATHLHELCDLPSTLPNVGAAQMGVVPREPRPGEPPAAGGGADDAVEFTYKLVPGAATHSHGLHAARVAGFPPAVLRRAQELLSRDARARGSA